LLFPFAFATIVADQVTVLSIRIFSLLRLPVRSLRVKYRRQIGGSTPALDFDLNKRSTPWQQNKHYVTGSLTLEHSKQIVTFLLELRRAAKGLFIAIGVTGVAIFFLSSGLLSVFQEHLKEKLYFFSVAGPFLSHVKISLFAALYLLMPWIMHVIWKALGQPFGMSNTRRFWFVFSTCLLFYCGTLFCYLITLPYGVKFLLGFQSEHLKPVISISRFVNFITIFILAFGIIFELPVFMVFSAGVGVSRSFYITNRRFAILGIAILAALLTPTPDVVNMALMGGPLYLLYELGILVIKIFNMDKPKTKSANNEPPAKTP